MTFTKALKNELNTTTTENGAKAYKSTLNSCLDLYGKIAACRSNIQFAEKLFLEAYDENPETAVRILFYARDIRGGQGERCVFRAILNKLATLNPTLVSRLIDLIPYYGRWDDLMTLENTEVWGIALNCIGNQLMVDLQSETPSLLAKWLPSINASSKNSKRLGRKIANHMNWSERQYRKNLSTLRSKIKIVETLMCSNEWPMIDYQNLPSRAAFMYRNAFKKHDEPRYSEYLNKVQLGESKINAATLYPYDIVDKYLYQGIKNDKALELQWDALPNYMETMDFNGLVIADVSGSMNGMPMSVSISLAIYIAERNHSEIWKNKFLTFSQRPTIQSIVGTNIEEKIHYLSRADWDTNTDLMAVFQTVLKASINNQVSPKDMPEKLIIVSDMQFDQCCYSNKHTNFEEIQNLYKQSGYEMPQLVFWNVKSSANVPIKSDDTGTCLVSGCSPSILKSVLTGKFITPIEVMNNTVYVERYDPVGLAFA